LAAPPDFRIVVAPATGFAEIDAALAGLGLAPGPDDAVTPPAIPGEREFAYWTAAGGDALISYSFNPAVALRVLAFSGADAAGWKARASAQLPLLEPDGIHALLKSAEPRSVLLGLFAAAELKAAALIGDIEPLRLHRDQLISQAAARAAERLALAVLDLGAERLAAERRRHPGRSALFPRLGDADRRREILAWLLRDAEGMNEDAAEVLRAALADEDWRVRAAAMLVAVRLGAAALWPDIRKMALPTSSRSGLDRVRRSLLLAARKAALAELAGEPLPAGTDDKARLAKRLRDVVAGRKREQPDDGIDWIASLLELPERERAS
jgi:hypothetical protein